MSPFKNTLLSHFTAETIKRLDLRPIDFELLHELEFPGNSITRLFFIEDGVASMTTTFLDGSQVEVSLFGYESVVGVSALMGTRRSLNRIYTQIAGSGYSCTLAAAQAEFTRSEEFHSLTLRYVQAQLLQAAQSAGCNAKHNVDQRFARWLLLCADRANTETFKISQQLLSGMLGTTRPSVSLAAGALRDCGIIDYTRGIITILDVHRLQLRSCECYSIVKQHLGNEEEFDTSFIA